MVKVEDQIVALIAREAERAYRRGFQQGAVIGPELDAAGIWKWRFRRSLAKSPIPENGRAIPGFETPVDRLECECPDIRFEVVAILAKVAQ